MDSSFHFFFTVISESPCKESFSPSSPTVLNSILKETNAIKEELMRTEKVQRYVELLFNFPLNYGLLYLLKPSLNIEFKPNSLL